MASDKRVSKRGHPGQMARSCFRPRRLAVATAIALLPWTSQVLALPTGEKTLFGNVDYSRPNNQTMNINVTTPSGGSSFTSFSIDAGQTVNIQQLSTSSTYLIKDVGGMASQIYGVLNANGQVFMSNTSGVFFARGAEVNVGALFATSLNINPVDFAAGRYNFYRDGNAGTVVNQGVITASAYAALAGPQVRNDGVIVARAGTVALAAGDRVSLDMIGDGLIKVSVDQAALNAAAINTGRIEADGGNVLLTARSANALLDTVINNSGVIRANSLVERNGEIILDGGSAGMVANSGTLQATGKDTGLTGGTVKVLGDRIALFKGTLIDASGNSGGGTVLIGGNYQGNGPEANASRTYVEAGARINADAIRNGDGGNVIVWSEQQTVFDGAISTRGGRQSGNGGFVEVSGKHFLSFTGAADRRAPHGRAGTLLLDPTDMIITAAGGAVSCFLGVCSDNGDTSMLSTSVLQAALAGGDVNVNATAGAGAGSGTINWTDGSVNAGGNSLTLTGITITFNGTLTNLNNLTFAGNGGSVNGAGSASSVGGSITGIGNATFDITGLKAGTAGAVSFSGFTAADSQNVTSAVNFDHGNRSSEGMTFAAATSVSGTGGITNMGANAFNLTGVAQGSASGVSYSGFTTADTTTVTGASGFNHGAKSNLGMTFAAATSVSGTGGVTNMGATAFDVTGVTQGTAGSVNYSGFTTADTTTVTSAPGFDATAKSTAGMVFANATSVSGTGGLTNMGASAFNVTGATQGTASGVSYSGFSAADTTTVTSAPGFDDTAKTTAGMVFANASSVSGTGTITNVVNNFNDSTRFSSGSGITYGAGFTALTTLNGGDLTGTASFALTGANAGTAASGDTYTGFASSSSATTVSGASGFDHGAKSSLGMTFVAATSVSGTGGITNLGATAFDVTGITQGNAGGITYSGFTAADTTTVTSAPGFDDAAKSTSGITFANATSVFGSGAITNVTGDFDDSSRVSSASLITYGSGFTSVAGTLAGSVKGTTTFNLSGANSGTADSGDTYTGFGASTAITVNGVSGFNDATRVTQGMTFASATSVNGTGGITAVAGDFNDSTRLSSASLITYGSGFTSVAGTIAGSVTGTTSFHLTGANAGTADSGDTYTGFGASTASTVTGASGFNHGAKSSFGMTFAAATSVSGTGGITNMGASAFNVTGVTQGTAGGVSYSGFTTADTTTVTSAPGFDDTAKATAGMVFANASGVSGTGTITNVVGNFNDTTRLSSGSGITYGAGFTALTTLNGGDITGTASFALSGPNAGTAASGDTYSGFASSSSATTVSGASGFNHGAKSSLGMTFLAATSVSGTGGITNMGASAFNVTGVTQGTAGAVSYSGFTTADTTTVTSAPGFDDTAKTTAGMAFANATSVSGTGTITHVVSNFNDTTRLSSGTGITYGAGFTALTTLNGGNITGTASFALTGANAGAAASGDTYTGFGSSSSASTVSGASGFNDTARTSLGMTFAAATNVSGSGTIANVVSNFNDTTRLSSGSGITYGAGFTALTTLNGGNITGTPTFALTGANAGSAASGDTYTGFASSSSATTVSGASGFNHGAKSSLGMTFAAATTVSGSGGITNMGATAFNVTGSTQGNAAAISYSGFTAADTTKVTNAPGFNDGGKSTAGMTFANAASVTGTGTISNVGGAFNDATQVSTASGIDYAGFNTVTGTGTTLNAVAGSFNDSTKISAATGINYAGLALNTVNGTGGSVNGVAGTFNVTSKTSGVSGINYSGFGVSTVSGAGGGATIIGSGLTYTLANGTPDAGSSAGVTWSAFPNISDSTGTLNMQASGKVTGNVTAQTINYSGYATAVTVDLSGAAGMSTGITGTRSGVTTIIGSGSSNDTIVGNGAVYNLTGQNSGSSGGLGWASFENITDVPGGTFFLFVQNGNVTGTLSSGSSMTLNSSSDITALTVSVPGTLTLIGTGPAPRWTLSGPPAIPHLETNNPATNVTYNNACIGGPACNIVIAIVGSINASVSQIAAQALKDAQATDSVAKQIDYGFAGDVGTTPPMDHRIDETGISTPDCFDESREGQACKAN